MRVTHTSGIQCDHFCCFCCPMGDRPEHTPLASGLYRRIRALQRASGLYRRVRALQPLASTGGSEHCSGQRSSGLYRRVRALQRAAILWPLPAGLGTTARSEPPDLIRASREVSGALCSLPVCGNFTIFFNSIFLREGPQMCRWPN